MTMRIIERSNQFKKDFKKIVKRGKNIEKIKTVIQLLSYGEKLAEKYRDHFLVGQYKNTRECHIEPDWLLIYVLTETTLRLERTGTHADLFN
ncbi:MAG: type II toxin-antitoxin system YafQ family toxin [Legionellales bacterium]|nr:type II toxin-antitoxin system YafQ family toxin [Legionellales bacterium]